jgi:very-short-patch-repair endonuclease
LPKIVSTLNQVVSYWRTCIQQEDMLRGELSPLARKKAVLDPFSQDPFIFLRSAEKELPPEQRLLDFRTYAEAQGLDCYYGYPLLLYRAKDGSPKIAPLLVLKITFRNSKEGLVCVPEELPTCGLAACAQLGLRDEEIKVLCESIEQLCGLHTDPQHFRSAVLALLESHMRLPLVRPLDPFRVGIPRLTTASSPGIHNDSVLFVGENTAFNEALIQDLTELETKTDLSQTALDHLATTSESRIPDTTRVPVLPFPCNEYQVAALRQIQRSSISVVTGPPGTGKSQFIANLIVNMFLDGHSVLFVSHTNDAVDVVNRKLNEEFPRLMLRTGNKDQRQELTGQVQQLFQDMRKDRVSSLSRADLDTEWNSLLEIRSHLLGMAASESTYERMHDKLSDGMESFGIVPLQAAVLRQVASRLDTCRTLMTEVRSLAEKVSSGAFGFWERVLRFFQPRRYHMKLQNHMAALSEALSGDALKVLRRGEDGTPLSRMDDPAWHSLPQLLALAALQKDCDDLYQRLRLPPTRNDLQLTLERGEKRFHKSSLQFLRETYLKSFNSSGNAFGQILSFINTVAGTTRRENTGLGLTFRRALGSLRIWSSTLKSLRRTFPLEPAVFDFVIFDEASQVDLPSAAPALYRAKRAVIVGDPMQLPHIAILSSTADKAIATSKGLNQQPELYPARVGYRTISLYKSAEAALTSPPILLANHYRSEDQIIGLCNRVFYQDQLKILTTLDPARYPATLQKGLHWTDCKGTAFRLAGGSRANECEALRVAEEVKSLLPQLNGTKLTIGIVTPFSGQRERITTALQDSVPQLQWEAHGIKVLTAHRFQGSERDIMLFSPVLAGHGDATNDSWFNANPQILNVALSRARYLLRIVGDMDFCRGRDGVLGKIVAAYEEIKRIEHTEELSLGAKLDTPCERLLFSHLQNAGIEQRGFKLIPKLVAQRYTLDIAIVGTKRIDVECDGPQHELIDGIPVLEDVRRDQFLRSRGWEVYRAPNSRILHEPDALAAEILSMLE